MTIQDQARRDLRWHPQQTRRPNMTKRTGGSAKPRITLTAIDHEKLSALADAAAHTMPEVAAELADELDRAHVLPKWCIR
jgi:hypothetical protein